MQNLVIADHLDKLLHDLSQVSDRVGYILDLTPRFHGLDLEKIKKLQEELKGKIQILYGYTPKTNYLAKMVSIDNLE